MKVKEIEVEEEEWDGAPFLNHYTNNYNKKKYPDQKLIWIQTPLGLQETPEFEETTSGLGVNGYYNSTSKEEEVKKLKEWVRENFFPVPVLKLVFITYEYAEIKKYKFKA